MILVTGATGNVGSGVVRHLVRIGHDVRAFVRDPQKARSMLGEGVELAVGDFADTTSLRIALEAVDAVFLSSGDGPEKVEFETRVIDEAERAGVGRIVKASTVLAEAGSSLPPLDWNGQIERHLASSGVSATILQSCFYMSNIFLAAEPIRAQGVLPAAAGTARSR